MVGRNYASYSWYTETRMKHRIIPVFHPCFKGLVVVMVGMIAAGLAIGGAAFVTGFFQGVAYLHADHSQIFTV